MVGSHNVNRAIGEALADCLHVFASAKWRVDLVERIVSRGHFLSEEQVVWSYFCRHVNTHALAPTNQVYRSGSRKMAHVEARTDVLCQQNVAGNDRLFSDGRPTGQTEFTRQWRFIHLRTVSQVRILRVLRNDATEGLHIFEGTTHENRIRHALAIIRKDAHLRAGMCHRTHRRQVLASEALSHGTDRANINPSQVVTDLPHLIDNRCAIGNRGRVRHRVNGCVATHRRSARAGFDRFGVFTPGFPQVRVHIDEAGKRDQTVGINMPGIGGAVLCFGTDSNNDAVTDQDVAGLLSQNRCAGNEPSFRGVFSHWCFLPWQEAGRGQPYER